MSSVANVIDNVFELIQIKLERLKLKAQGQIAFVLGKVVGALLVALFLALSLVFLSTGVALWLNDLWESQFLGFIAMGIFYVLMLIIGIMVMRSKRFAQAIEDAILENRKKESL